MAVLDYADLWTDGPAAFVAWLRLRLDPPWMKDAACREHPEVNFFPERGEPAAPARAICRQCLVKDECLAFALADPDAIRVGVWGGTTAPERVRQAGQRTRRDNVPFRWSDDARARVRARREAGQQARRNREAETASTG